MLAAEGLPVPFKDQLRKVCCAILMDWQIQAVGQCYEDRPGLEQAVCARHDSGDGRRQIRGVGS